MPRIKKVIPIILIAVFLLTGLYLYWEREIPLADVLPNTAWTNIRVLAGTVDSQEREQELVSPPLEKVLTAISETNVTRDSENHYLGDAYFQLYLYPDEGYPTVIYVRNNGEIMVAPNMDFDHYRYYEDGEELYQALEHICDGLPPLE